MSDQGIPPLNLLPGELRRRRDDYGIVLSLLVLAVLLPLSALGMEGGWFVYRRWLLAPTDPLVLARMSRLERQRGELERMRLEAQGVMTIVTGRRVWSDLLLHTASLAGRRIRFRTLQIDRDTDTLRLSVLCEDSAALVAFLADLESGRGGIRSATPGLLQDDESGWQQVEIECSLVPPCLVREIAGAPMPTPPGEEPR
ncbi:MAG: hypothetical protein HY608_07490 [Planctomycetes bacterium]|nr:hypothetical protein [Planctomycetota bacterium]